MQQNYDSTSNVPGHGCMEGTTNRVGIFKSPYAALYNWKDRRIARHSSLSPGDAAIERRVNGAVVTDRVVNGATRRR